MSAADQTTTATAATPRPLPASLAEASAEQPGVAVALASALDAPSHAYLFTGPPGSGKRSVARAFAAELIAAATPDSDLDAARRRALADPPLHPDLAWIRPPGAQHLVDQIREGVIDAIAYRPFEAERRAFVIEGADAMAEESQNALLKTLEEPPAFAHLILISSQPGALLETVRSRCQEIRFASLPAELLGERLAVAHPEVPAERISATARLAGGDGERAELLLSEPGAELRDAAEAMIRATISGDLDGTPWKPLLDAAGAAGEREGELAAASLERLADEVSDADERAAKRLRKEAGEVAKRSTRRGRLLALDAGLRLATAWLRDLVAIGEGAPESVLHTDRSSELGADAEGLDPRRARRAAELVMDTRRRLTVNVSEELALEALCFRLEFILASA